MLKLSWVYITRKVCKFLIVKTIVLDQKSFNHYNRMDPFYTVDLTTAKGAYQFMFKKDRRTLRRSEDKVPAVTTYIVEMVVPEGRIPNAVLLSDKMVVVVKIAFGKPNYQTLCEVLLEMYFKKIGDYGLLLDTEGEIKGKTLDS